MVCYSGFAVPTLLCNINDSVDTEAFGQSCMLWRACWIASIGGGQTESKLNQLGHVAIGVLGHLRQPAVQVGAKEFYLVLPHPFDCRSVLLVVFGCGGS